jgi:DNA-directed RNA polymerase subunit RPC12/RpoP
MAERFHCLDCGVEFGEPEAKQADYRCSDCGAGLLQKTSDGGVAEKKKMGSGRVFFAIFVLLCLVVAIFFVWQAGSDKTGGLADNSSKAQAIEQIINKAMEINTKTPLMIDKSTRLDLVVVEDKTITYKTTLINLTAENVDNDMFKRGIAPFLSEKYCSDKNTHKALELGVKYDHEYFGNNGALLYTASISFEDC